MAQQGELFGFEDLRPRLNLAKAEIKKIVTKERIEEMKRLYAAGDARSLLDVLERVNEKLDKLDKRISNKKQKL